MAEKETTSSSLKSLLLRQSFFQASVLIISFSFLSKVLGYVREMTIAGLLGAKAFTDAFFLAQVIPILGASLITSALPLVFIPLYLQEREKNEEEAEKFASALFWGVIFYIFLFSLAMFLLSAPLTKLIAPGFKGEQLLLTRRFLVYLLPLVLFQCLQGFFTAYLQAQKHFFFPAWGFICNIPIILSLFLFARQHPFQSLVLGFNLGYFLFFLILFLAALYLGFRPFLSFNFFHPAIRRLLILILPVVVGSGLSYIDMLIARSIGSYLGEGVISSLSYAYRLLGIPTGLMAGSISVAVFPFLSSQAVALDRGALARETMRALRATWLISLPIAVIFILLPQPIIRIMFERGAFTPEATQVTSTILSFFSYGVLAMTAWGILTRTFYSLQDTFTPLKVSFLQIALNISLLLTLPRFLGYRGIPIATSLSITLGCLLLWELLSQKLPEVKEERISEALSKVLAMCLVQAVFLFLTRRFLWEGRTWGLLSELLLLAVAGGASFLLFLGIGYLVKYPEMGMIKRILRRAR